MTSMPESSQPAPERARKYVSSALRAIASVGQRPLAEALGVSEATVSRHISEGHLERALQILAQVGLKVVHADRVCVRESEWMMITRIASRALANERTARELLFEDLE